jgi:hypothetical protein
VPENFIFVFICEERRSVPLAIHCSSMPGRLRSGVPSGFGQKAPGGESYLLL